MPSASDKVPTQEKDIKVQTGDVTEPFKQVVTLIEHKIRNMEKRKAKLDAYKQEQANGKDLIADQLAAVSKYGELTQCLDFARDLSKQVSQMQVDTTRLVKKQAKREQAEKAAAEAERTKELIILTKWLHALNNHDDPMEDFKFGRNGAICILPDEIDGIETLGLYCGILLKRKVDDEAADHLALLVDGAQKVIPTTPVTYGMMKEILLSMEDCDYSFDRRDNADGVQDWQEPGREGEAEVTSSECTQVPAKFGYVHPHGLIESPEMDPAVVATSTTAPPQLMTQQLQTMQQVIPNTQLVIQLESERLDHLGQVDSNEDWGMGNPGNEGEGGEGHMQSLQQEHALKEVNEFHQPQPHQQHQHQQEWITKETKFVGYGANPGDMMDGNDFMENNFSTWEGGPHGDSRGSTGYRRGGQRGRGFHNSNGFQARGGGGGGGRGGFQGNPGQGNGRGRWGPPQAEGRYDDYRGRGETGEFRAPRGGGGVERPYYNSGPRNGAPRGRFFRGGSGYGA